MPTKGDTSVVREVAAIVATQNSASILDACLDSLATNMESEPGLTVVVVDNGSIDGTISHARAHKSRPQVVVQENLGFAAAINAGIEELHDNTSHVLVLRPAVRFEAEAVSRLADAIERDDVGIAVPRMVDGGGRVLHSLRREPTALRVLGEAIPGKVRVARHPALREVITHPAAYEKPTHADWATGDAMLLSASCRRDVGEWDERYFQYSEDTDYALRARDLGHKLQLVPEAGATHLSFRSDDSRRFWSLPTINRIRLQRRRKGMLKTIPFVLAIALSTTLRLPAERRRSTAAAEGAMAPSAFVPDLKRASERNPDYMLFAGKDWWYHSQAHSDFQLFKRIAQTRDVLVVNSIGMRMPTPGRTAGAAHRIVRKLVSATRLMRKPVRGLFGFNVMTPLLVPWYGHPLGRTINAFVVSAQVRLAGSFAGLSKPIIVATLPTAIDVVDRIPHRRLVYNRSDKHSAFAESNEELIRVLEERMLTESDLVVYASSALLEEDRPLAEGRQVFLDHGVDLHHFDPDRPMEEPDDVRGIPKPRVGFFGGLRDYVVDFDLIRSIARELSWAQVVLVGDKMCSDEEMERMTAFPNLTWLGFRPYEQIPAYGAAFDVAIMPWLDNDWIRRCNPIKLKEYLALGLPVVSIDFPGLARYADVVSVAADRDDFVMRVADALEAGGPGTPESRRAAVADASWDERARVLMAAVEALDPP